MEVHELERIRRSIVMLSPGQRVGPLSREEVLELIGELQEHRAETTRYRALAVRLRALLDELDAR